MTDAECPTSPRGNSQPTVLPLGSVGCGIDLTKKISHIRNSSSLLPPPSALPFLGLYGGNVPGNCIKARHARAFAGAYRGTYIDADTGTCTGVQAGVYTRAYTGEYPLAHPYTSLLVLIASPVSPV